MKKTKDGIYLLQERQSIARNRNVRNYSLIQIGAPRDRKVSATIPKWLSIETGTEFFWDGGDTITTERPTPDRANTFILKTFRIGNGRQMLRIPMIVYERGHRILEWRLPRQTDGEIVATLRHAPRFARLMPLTIPVQDRLIDAGIENPSDEFVEYIRRHAANEAFSTEKLIAIERGIRTGVW